jgi:hypothetical protein
MREFRYIECYTDSDIRSWPNCATDNSMIVARCIGFAHGYKYAGLENGK